MVNVSSEHGLPQFHENVLNADSLLHLIDLSNELVQLLVGELLELDRRLLGFGVSYHEVHNIILLFETIPIFHVLQLS